MTEARDIRFRGTDPRLYRVAQSLGLDLTALDTRTLTALNTRTLPGAVAAAVEAQGLPDSADARSLFADLLRNEAADRAEHPGPAKLSQDEALKRARLHLLASALSDWAGRAKLPPKYRQKHGTHARGLDAVFAEVARREGAQASTVKRWCMDDAEAKALIAAMRPVKARSGPHKPLRGLRRTAPIGDAGSALQDAWK
jgi:hypothetical protein